ncbi:MAG: thiamine-phosphate kinase [Nitrospira sp. CR1.3]|nr:thiamine-phosphate kinase [Nitrospira sp. CR1.3]
MALPPSLKAHSSPREFDLIRTIRRRFAGQDSSVLQGIGDDAAVISPSSKQDSLLATDLLAEGVHFDMRTATPADVGFRAAAANLSDIAAMGGRPRYLLVALAIPRTATGLQIRRLYQGLMAACRPHGVRLIGGDTSASMSGWFIAVTLVGSVPPNRALLRSGARAGDSIYVTGTLGDSLAGLVLAKESKLRSARGIPARALSSRHRRFLIQRHLRPTARIAIGRWLSAQRLATSAIDLSDGLSGDLSHICEESRVGAEIEVAKLPLSTACRAFAETRKTDSSNLALTGGEDYELLFTTPARLRAKLERTARELGYRITRIGTIRPARFGLQTLSEDGRRRPLSVTSYEHFRSHP